MTEQATQARPRAAAKKATTEVVDQVEAAQREELQAALDAHGDILKAIVWVTGKIEKVAKNGRNDRFNYVYATKDDIIAALKPLMLEAGLAILPHHVSSERSEPNVNGTVTLVAKWNMQIIHRGGGSLVVPWESESMDNGDKNIGKAATSAKKMFYRALFDIPDGEPDLEHDANAGHERTGGEQTQRASSSGGGAAPGGAVSTKTILDFKETHGLNNVQLAWAVERAGGDKSAKIKDLDPSLRPAILANLEKIVAGAETQAQEAQAAPDESGDPYGASSASPADEDIPF